jgi:quinol-cytochrome oxidoreductase complex cytochrome b subunit
MCHHGAMMASLPRLPANDRERARWTRFTFLLHMRPVQVPRRTLRWTHTFGLGGSSLVLLILLVTTGVLQMLVYQPVPGLAYDSVVTLEREVVFGPLVRGVHYWSANLLILVVLLHTARTMLTGGHRGRRSFTWVLGVGLLGGVLTSAFTGYLLPWDQLSYWAVTIATGMLTYVPGVGEFLQRVVRGGDAIGGATLVNI